MNRIYKTVWNEQTRTFVAVSELARARGKRSGSSVSSVAASSSSRFSRALALGAIVLSGAGLLGASVPVLADVVVGDEPAVSGNSIEFIGGGSISGLTDSTIAEDGTNAVTTGQLWTTNDALATVTTTVTNLGTTVTGLGTTVSGQATQITDHEGRITANETSIGTLQTAASTAVSYDSSTKDVITLEGASGTRITNLANGAINATSTDAVTGQQIHNLFIDTGAGGVRYFHANSAEADSVAEGDQSIAIGPKTVASAKDSLAAGQEATVAETAEAGMALGRKAAVGTGATSAVAIGDEASVDVAAESAVAIGHEASAGAGASDSVAIGSAVSTTGASAVSVGHNALAAENAVGIGSQAIASGSNSIALGMGAEATTHDSIALGTNAGQGTVYKDPDDGARHSHIAIGENAGQRILGNESISIGVNAGSGSINDYNIAIGSQAGTNLDGERNVALGYMANQKAARTSIDHAVSIGGLTQAQTNGVALGYLANAGDGGVAIGESSKASSKGVAIGQSAEADAMFVALGQNSVAKLSDVDAYAGYLTGTSSSSAVSVGNSSDTTYRRITNVADGAQNNDAVNVAQLKKVHEQIDNFIANAPNISTAGGGVIANVADAVVDTDAVNLRTLNQAIEDNQVEYFSVDPNGDSANRNNTGASGTNSMAIGHAAATAGESSLSIGHKARVSAANQATSVGYDTQAKADNSTAIGSGSVVDDEAGVAIGRKAYSRGENSLAMGTDAQTGQQNSGSTISDAIALGTSSRATATDASALGHSATATANKSTAIGYQALAGVAGTAGDAEQAANAFAMGTQAHASAVSAFAQGTLAAASAENAFAQGTKAAASGVDSFAAGTEAKANTLNAIAIGTKVESGFAGDAAYPDVIPTTNTVAIGNNSTVQGQAALALGGNNKIGAYGTTGPMTGNYSGAFGNSNTINQDNTFVVGNDVTTTQANSVVLGNASTDRAATAETSTVVDKVTYNFAGVGSAENGVISVGAAGKERQIINVAAGNISALSTDAINGSQLFQTNVAVTALGNNLDTAGSSVATVLGGNAAYDADTHKVTMTNIGGSNVPASHNTSINSAITYAAQGWNVGVDNEATGTRVAPGAKVDFSNTDGNIQVARTGTNLTFDLNEDIDLGTDGSVTTGNSVMDNSGLAVDDGAGNSTMVGAGTIGVTDGTGTTSITGNQVSVGGNNPVVISGDTGTIGGLTNTTFDPDNFTSGQAATEDQLKLVSDTASAGWNVTDGTNTNNIGPNGTVTFTGDSNITVTESGVDDNGVVTVALNEDIDLGTDGSVTTGNSELNNDGLTVDDGAGNSTTVGAGTIGVTDVNGTSSISGNQVSVGGSNPVVISGDTGTIGGLTNTTFDPDNFTSGQAATEDQLKSISDIASAGWYVGVGGEATGANVASGAKVDFSNTDGNIEVARTGTDLTFDLNKDIDLGSDGSVTTGNSVMDNSGLTVDDGAGNKTTTAATGTTVTDGTNTSSLTAAGTTMTDGSGNTTTTTAAGTTVTNAAGDTTTVGAGIVTVAGAGSSTITIDGNTGTIGGLTNTTFDPDNFTSGQAATEDQLKSVSDVANAGWNVSANGAGSTSANIGPNGDVMFNGDSNITVTQTGVDDDGVINVALNEDIDLGADGSVTTGNTVMDNTGLTINDTTAGTLTSIGSGAIALADSTGNVTTIDPTSVMVGGSFPIAINGNTGIISGLQNQTVNYAGFGDGSGRAATEEQLKPISDFVALNNDGTFSYNGKNHPTLQAALDSMHWNVEAPAPDNSGGGSGGTGGTGGTGGGTGGTGSGGNTTPIHNSNTVGFVAGNNIVISKTDRANGAGADIKVAMADDISVNSITAVQVNAGQVNADRIEINNGGPVIDEKGIDMAGKPITNVAAGVNETDAVNVGQLQQAAGNLQNQVNDLRGDLRRQDKRLSGGVAAAMATAALPQAYLPGKTMMSMAGGTWNSESGMAIGFSGISDNGHWVYKLSGNATSRGDYGGAVGVGYQW